MDLQLNLFPAGQSLTAADADAIGDLLQQSLSSQRDFLGLTVACNNQSAVTVAQEVIARLPVLDAISLRIHMVAGEEGCVLEDLLALGQRCNNVATRCCVDIVLQDDSDGFDYLAGNNPQLALAITLSQRLSAAGISIRWLLPLSVPLLFRLEGLVSVARAQAIEVLLLPANIVLDDGPALDQLEADERLFCWDFVTYRLLEADQQWLAPGCREYYRELASWLDYQPVSLQQSETMYISRAGGGDWQATASESRAPASCFALLNADSVNEVAPGRMDRLRAIGQDVADVFSIGVKGHLLRSLVGSEKLPLEGRVFKRVLLIGAYGGEHIGDAAILGGVLLRMHRTYGTTEAVLMTQRLDHTKHLIPMLDVPVDVSVDIYEQAQIQTYVAQSDCVVFAGGPLIDLPKQLVRHLYAVSLAHKAGKPFIAEGIGPGPFARMPSRFTAHRLIDMASRISLRAADAAEHELVRDKNFEVGLCPAFDYLETRGQELSRLPAREITEIETLLADTQGRPIVGVNIRPIGYLYTHGAPDSDVEGFTRRTEAAFEDQLAEGLLRFSEQSERKPCFVFFPMNAIQFGMSDLRSAYRIQERLQGKVDFRVWEADASLDGVLALIRRLDVAITMRFHAAIFALSQQCKVIGIDYRIGKKDKVAGLLDDVGQGEHCARIDLLSADWLEKKLIELL